MEGSKYTFKKYDKVLAVQRLESLEKRLIKNPDKAKQYSDTIKKYIELGHATKFSTTESAPLYTTYPTITSLTRTNRTNSESSLMLQQNLQGQV